MVGSIKPRVQNGIDQIGISQTQMRPNFDTSLVFDTPQYWILDLYLDFLAAKNIMFFKCWLGIMVMIVVLTQDL